MSTVRAIEPQPGYVRQRAAALVRDGGGARVLLLRAKPTWREEPVLDIDGNTVRVVEGISALAVLDAYARRADGEYLLVLTDRSEDDLGEDVLLSAWRQRVENVREWDAIPALFRGARVIDNELRRVGSWAPTALLDHLPAGGWPTSPTRSLTATLALGSLLAHLLGEAPTTTLDGALTMSVLHRPERREAWRGLPAELRGHLTDWAATAIGEDAALALRVAGRENSLSPLAVALAADVLWPATGTAAPDEAQLLARGRFETKVDGKHVGPESAHSAAATGRAVVSRMALENDPGLRTLLLQAEAILPDLGWPAGAERSTVLPAGYTARLHALGQALMTDRADAVERALQDLREHESATPGSELLEAATMAVRLWRWLHSPHPPAPESLEDSLNRQLSEGGWVDRAVGVLWNVGGPLQAAARGLVIQARAERQDANRRAAQQLAAATASGRALHGAVFAERFLADVIIPMVKRPDTRVLVIVLDAMSASAATQVAHIASQSGMVEWVPTTGTRLPALAVLPSLTEHSRTSLLTGGLQNGHGANEKSGLAAAVPGARVFHKDDLRAGAGDRLPEDVRDAIGGDAKVLAAVINTIDDTLHKVDASAVTWTRESLQPLSELLDLAQLAGREVVLTSDHGYVLEHSTEQMSGVRADGRWRSADLGPAGEGEVLVEGPRVLAPGGRAVLLWDESLRYGRKQTGYHGGASLPEITIPVLLMRARGAADLPGWMPAPPLTPTWWNDPVRTRVTTAPPKQAKSARAKPAPQEDSLFEVAATESAATTVEGTLVARVLGSSTYRAQRERAGARAPSNAVVEKVLQELLDRQGRAHLDTVAAVAGWPGSTATGALAALRRVLNVDGYGIVGLDGDGVTVLLDEGLLREQFGVN